MVDLNIFKTVNVSDFFVASGRQAMNNVLPQQQDSNAFRDSTDNVLNTIFS